MITTVIFDLDDTLYEEMEYCRSGFRVIARFLHRSMRLPGQFNEDRIYETLWKAFTTGDRGRTFNVALDELGIEYNEEVIASMVKLYREHEPTICLPEATRQVLDKLKRQYRLAMLTDGFLPAQQLKVRALAIADYFDHILYTESLGRSYWKPHVKGFEMLLKKLGAAARECVYVGDNAEKDFIAPNSLGMATIQLVHPNRVHPSSAGTRDAAPQQIIASLSQLPAAIRHLGEQTRYA